MNSRTVPAWTVGWLSNQILAWAGTWMRIDVLAAAGIALCAVKTA
jgi:hypothetical protein